MDSWHLKAYGAFVLVCGIFAVLVGLSGHFDWQARLVCAVSGFEVARGVFLERRSMPKDQRENEGLAHLMLLVAAGVSVAAALVGPSVFAGQDAFLFRMVVAMCGVGATVSGFRELVS